MYSNNFNGSSFPYPTDVNPPYQSVNPPYQSVNPPYQSVNTNPSYPPVGPDPNAAPYMYHPAAGAAGAGGGSVSFPYPPAAPDTSGYYPPPSSQQPAYLPAFAGHAYPSAAPAPYLPSGHQSNLPPPVDPALQALMMGMLPTGAAAATYGGGGTSVRINSGTYAPVHPDGFHGAPSMAPPPPPPSQPPQQFQANSILKMHNQDYDSLKHYCLNRGELFHDQQFPTNRILMAEGGSSRSIEWMRPHEICQTMRLNTGPAMFVSSINRFDVNQGEIGNCWFLAALATLAENHFFFEQVVPPNQGFEKGEYTGIFRFRFWRFGEWVEIVIDDQLPTRRGELIYLRSRDKNEFWSALLEKAYAKLHGSYKALEGGLTIEAAVDFTGGIPEMIELAQAKMTQQKLFAMMQMASARGAFMGCALNPAKSREARDLGLQSQHAYTITKVVELSTSSVKTSIPLIRIRNPHGNHREWKGDWSDNDSKWRGIPDDVKQSLGLTFSHDGEFYMSFPDFLRYYGDLEMCHVAIAGKKEYEMFSFQGQWRSGISSGGCGNDGSCSFAKNPQFFITLNDPDPYDNEENCSVVVSLMQRQTKRKAEFAIGFKVYKCDLETKKMTETDLKRTTSRDRTDAFINLREVSKRLQLPQGRYCIIPSTFRVGEEADFLLRVFVEKSWGSADMGRGGGGNSARMDTRIQPRFGSAAAGGGSRQESWSAGPPSNNWAYDQSSCDEVIRGLIQSLNIQA